MTLSAFSNSAIPSWIISRAMMTGTIFLLINLPEVRPAFLTCFAFLGFFALLGPCFSQLLIATRETLNFLAAAL
jgi:hypothetical protein